MNSLREKVQLNPYFLPALCLPSIVIMMNSVRKSSRWTIDLGLCMYVTCNNALCKKNY